MKLIGELIYQYTEIMTLKKQSIITIDIASWLLAYQLLAQSFLFLKKNLSLLKILVNKKYQEKLLLNKVIK